MSLNDLPAEVLDDLGYVLPDLGWKPEEARATFVLGDVRRCLDATPDDSVDLVLTSPPFLALRSYLPADHPDKHAEIGSEPDPAAFLDTLLGLTAEFRRVLAPHGSICVELGDTYSGSGGAGGDYADGGIREGQGKFDGAARRTRSNNLYATGTRYSDDWNRGNTAGKPIEGVPVTGGPGWPLPKSLCGIPHLYHLSLAYGRNLLTGAPSPAGRWRVRNVVAWCRPNPPVGALGDKYRPATSYMTIACPDGSRYFDLDAVRTPGSPNTNARTAKGVTSRPSSGKKADDARTGGNRSTMPEVHSTNGAPPLDHWWHDEDTFDQDAWHIPTQPYSGSHFAVWPPALLDRPIKSMCPRKVCRVCGKPSERITTGNESPTGGVNGSGGSVDGDAPRRAGSDFTTTTTTTLGWSDCGHDDYRPGIVLDPFAGSGTTLMVATGLGRAALGFDLDARNVELARDRVGPMLLDDIVLPKPSRSRLSEEVQG